MNEALELFGLTTTPLELVSFLLSLLMVVLMIAQSHWSWLFSLLASALYGLVFWQARLYGDMGLQLVFIGASVWGWLQWLRGATAAHAPLAVSRLGRRGWIGLACGWLVGFGVLALFLRRYTDTDVPLADAFLTAGSLAGQLLLARKKLENWLVWIAVDVLYVGMFTFKHLYITAVLYVVYLALAIRGWIDWRRSLHADAPIPVT